MHPPQRGANKMKLDSFQYCPLTRQEAMDTKGNTGKSTLAEENLFIVKMVKYWNRLSGEVVESPPWRQTKPDRIRS